MWPQTKHVARVACKYLFTSFWVKKGYLSTSLSQKQSVHVSLITMIVFCVVNCSFNRVRAKKKNPPTFFQLLPESHFHSPAVNQVFLVQQGLPLCLYHTDCHLIWADHPPNFAVTGLFQ